ncbi:ATP-binding protein [Mesorhizobium sp. Cs1321R2N1]|uniref:ATP-binding protein n=1 Tax=Mesorhizobium sp. Cs1321R2N1 TaxID=3015174 RepID=UPI003FA5E409
MLAEDSGGIHAESWGHYLTLITIFGRPGAGKTTLGNEVAVRLGFTHMALGAMLRDVDVLKQIGIEPEEMERARASGRTVTNRRLYPWLDAQIRGTDRVVIDGYPRARNSISSFDRLVRSLPTSRIVSAIVLDCSVDVSHPRLHSRGRADDDGRIPLRDREFELVQRPLLNLLPNRVRRLDLDASRPTSELFTEVRHALGLNATTSTA